MATARVLDVRDAAVARRRPHQADFRRECRRLLEELRLIHAAHVARIYGENLQDSDADDELVVRSQSSSRHWLLSEIDDSIGRLADGTYGLCEDCHTVIPSGRLRIIPYARRCITCQSNRPG